MGSASHSPHAAEQQLAKAAPSSVRPVSFSSTFGLFTAACNSDFRTAVLFASPWGFEEMCTRKFWRLLAEQLADAGIASLRFDYPGTGDALDTVDFSAGIGVWEESLRDAAEMLKSLSGCDRLIVISQGLGCALAQGAADRLTGLDGIAFLAPTISGRSYLRELSVWSKMIDESLGLFEHHRDLSGLSIAGLKMPEAIAKDLRKVNLLTIEKSPAPRCLVVERPGRPTDAQFAAHLEGLGSAMDQSVYQGYDALVSNPSVSLIPDSVLLRVVDWTKSVATPGTPGAPEVIAAEARNAGAEFVETALVFGEENRLSGILCEPDGPRLGATVLLLTTAYDRHAGWGRSVVRMARQLAGQGIASLRFDAANVGDSPARPGAPAQVLYSDTQVVDVSEAIDLLEIRGLMPTVVVGRCSGGYLAFRSSLLDPRISGLVSANPYAFYWNPHKSVDDALRFGARSLGTYGQKVLRMETLRRLFRREIDIRYALLNIGRAIGKRTKKLTKHLLRPYTRDGSAVYGGFQALRERGVGVCLLYSEHDVGYDHFSFYFDDRGAGLSAYPNMSLTIIPDADHNLTPEAARSVYREQIRNMALKFPPPDTNMPR